MPQLPVTVFTGFLGSGKTTLLASLLAAERERAFAIVVNEFGAVSVDDVLLHQALGTNCARVFQLTQGLIAYGGNAFVATMQAISAEAHFFDHVLIETSGLAVPTAAIEALHSPELQQHFLHDATLTIVDTPLLLAGAYDASLPASTPNAGAAAAEVFQQQLQCADVVVLNKIDQCTEAALLQAETALRQRAPDIRFVECAWQARLDARLVLGLHLNEFRGPAHGGITTSLAGGQSPGDGHTHSGLSTHEHGLLTHEHVHAEDPGWLSFVLHSHAAQDAAVLQRALCLITAQEPVLRVKGFAHLHDAPGHLVVQGVRTRVLCTREPHHMPAQHDHQHTHTHDHHHAHSAMAELVFIGYHLDRQAIVARLCEYTGTTWG